MKYFFTLCVLFTAETILYSQHKIEGIGKLKIGSTTVTVIDELAKQFNLPIEETSDFMATKSTNFEDKPKHIFYISKDKNDGEEFPHNEYIRHPKVKVYYLDRFPIADMVLTDLTLKFYKDTLYYIYCEGSPELDSAIVIKYGQPKITVKKKPVRCSNAYRTVTYEETTYSKDWKNIPKGITASSLTSIYYNNSCEKSSLQFLLICKDRLSNKITAETIAAEDAREKKKAAVRKKALSEF